MIERKGHDCCKRRGGGRHATEKQVRAAETKIFFLGRLRSLTSAGPCRRSPITSWFSVVTLSIIFITLQSILLIYFIYVLIYLFSYLFLIIILFYALLLPDQTVSVTLVLIWHEINQSLSQIFLLYKPVGFSKGPLWRLPLSPPLSATTKTNTTGPICPISHSSIVSN